MAFWRVAARSRSPRIMAGLLLAFTISFNEVRVANSLGHQAYASRFLGPTTLPERLPGVRLSAPASCSSRSS